MLWGCNLLGEKLFFHIYKNLLIILPLYVVKYGEVFNGLWCNDIGINGNTYVHIYKGSNPFRPTIFTYSLTLHVKFII